MKTIFKLYRKLLETRWTLGFIDFDEESLLDADTPLKIHWIANNPKPGWFADPFILSMDDKYINVLVEEFVYGQRGRISKVVIDRETWRYERIVPLICLPTHLSFPAWFVKDGVIYIYPENSVSGKLTLYRYDPEKESTEAVGDLSLLPLVDAAICRINGKDYISATVPPEDNGKVLNFYPYDENTCPEDSGALFSVDFEDNVGRNAGFMFHIGNRLFRPAQLYGETYGECVVLQEFFERKNGIMTKEVRRIYSDNRKYDVGLHTFNVYDNRMIVVDGRGYRWPVMAKSLKFIVKLFKR